MMKQHGLKKQERLNRDIAIGHLFAEGKRSFAFPLLMFYAPTDEVGEVAILCSVAKKRFKHAVDRNRVKRLISSRGYTEEKVKDILKNQNTDEEFRKGIHIAFVMSHNQLPTFEQMNRSMNRLLKDIVANLGAESQAEATENQE